MHAAAPCKGGEILQHPLGLQVPALITKQHTYTGTNALLSVLFTALSDLSNKQR